MVTYIKKTPIELDIATSDSNTMCNTKIKTKYLNCGDSWFDKKYIGKIYIFSKLTDK